MSHENFVNRNILIAADESENARRAVEYVAKLLKGIKGFRITIMHLIHEPDEDFFPDDAEKEKWLEQYTQNVTQMLEEYRQILLGEGFEPENVSVYSRVRWCPSMAECILSERDTLEYGTIVVGRRGLSLKEEFLFGSVSGTVVRRARNCAIWVVA